MTLIVNKDESREVFNCNLPDSFHAQFGVFHALNALDAALGQYGCDTADGAEIEAAVFLAGIRNSLRAVALGNHDERAAVVLELVDIRIHAVGRGRPHRTAWVAFRRLGRSGIENGMILEVLW